MECALRAASRSGGLTWTMCAENALPAVAMQASAWTGGTLRVPTVVCAAAQLALRPPPHRALRGFCSSATASTTTGSDGSSNSSSGGGAEDDATPQEQLGSPSALHASMDKLVDTAASLVGEGRLQQAVEVLQRGIELLSNAYPGRCVSQPTTTPPPSPLLSLYPATPHSPPLTPDAPLTCLY